LVLETPLPFDAYLIAREEAVSEPDIVSVAFEMDPLSITAAAIGITTFALTSIRQLHDLISDVADAKDVLQDVSRGLSAILVPLDTLRELHASERGNISDAAKADLGKTGVAEAVNRCGDLCDEFAKKLEKWTKHSTVEKMALRDRLTLTLNKEKIVTLRMSVESCQSAVQFAVQTTQL
jgi:hypothetical protein